MTTATPRRTPCKKLIHILPLNVATVSSVLVKYEMNAFNSKGRYENCDSRFPQKRGTWSFHVLVLQMTGI